MSVCYVSVLHKQVVESRDKERGGERQVLGAGMCGVQVDGMVACC